jgi:hypothetical protein
MSKPADKFEATRIVVETVKEFAAPDQEMIFRWAAESLALPEPFVSLGSARRPTESVSQPLTIGGNSAKESQDILSFVNAKKPRSDVQFAAVVAYYYQFVAPESERKSSISEADLIDSCRKVGRGRPQKPYFTLNNAFHAGLLDRPEKGSFSINSVGENLVALTLPGGDSSESSRKRPKKPSVKKQRRKSRV